MFDQFRLKDVLVRYKQDFVSMQWKNEKYKWEAVKWFQDHWDVNATDFPTMLNSALDKTFNLLASANNFPKGMIVGFAKSAPEEVRAMFIDLFDESKDVYERIDAFKLGSSKLLERYGNGAAQHYQLENAITTYLWLRYPDKYYIYKFSEVKVVASELEADYRFKKGAYADNVRNFIKLYDEVCSALQGDQELVNLLRSQLTDTCYPDPELRTLTIDVGFYISRYYSQRDAEQVAPEEWVGADYNPNLSVEDWKGLLQDETVFTPSALQIMKRMKDYGGTASCTQLAVKYGETKNFYNSGSVALARRVCETANVQPATRSDGSTQWWTVLYTGRDAGKDDEGSFLWKLRDELSAALDQTDLSAVELYVSAAPGEEEHGYWWLNANPKIWSFSDIAVGQVQSYTLFNENGNKRRIFQNFLDAKAGDMIIGYESNPVKQIVAIGRIHMAMVDQYTRAIDILDADEETAKKLETSTWNHEKCYFLINLSLDDGSLLPLQIVDEEEFASTVPDENEGVFCCADELPGMNEVEDQLHYCLTTNGLFHWSEGHWIAITHVEEADHDLPEADDSNTDDANESDSLPEVAQAVTTDSETAAAPVEPIAPVKQQTIPMPEPAEGLWLDDLSEETEVEPEVTLDEFANLSSAEIAGRLLNAASNGSIPSDESMSALIHQLLKEGVRSHDVRNCHDQLVEAVVFAKVLSSNDAFPMCRNIYLQLHAAIPFFREAGANTGVALSGIFADETEFTPVTKLCAYIYGMLFPAHAHDHTFAALYNNAFTEYESQFPGLDVLKPLYHKAMEGVKLVPTAFSPANLAALSDSRIRQERMSSIRSQARDLLKPPTVKVMIHGVPELIDLCFGSQTDLHTALQIVADNEISMRELVEAELDKYCKDDDIDISTLERLLDSQWSVAAQKYSSRRMGIKYDARKHLLHAFEERLNLLRDWLDETNTESEPDIEKLRAIRNEVLRIIEDSLAEINIAPYSAAYGIMKAALELIRAKLQNQGSGVDFTTLLRSGMMVIDHGELILNDDLNEIEFAEPWRMMLQHIACTEYDLKIVYDRILVASPDSILYDNFGQMEAIGRLIGADPKEYELTSDGLRDAINSADLQARNFREKLEISYAYNRISENDRERLAMLADPETSDFQKFFYDHRAFGCWRGFLKALREQIREAAQQSMHDVRAQLDQAKAMLHADEESPLMAEAERLISQEQNYAVAEDYIHRFRNGERDLPFETNEGVMSHFLTFVSDAVFPGLYGFCERHKQDPMPRWAVQYMKNNTPEGWTTRHIEDAQRFIEKWPISKQAVNAQNIQEYFKLLGLHVERCAKSTRGNEVCCTLTVNKSEQNLADYRHPISIFGTQMKSQIEVVCLFGKRTATQLIDDACKLGITSTFIVLLDADLSTADRRLMAKYVFTQKNVGQASFLVIDRVLALYLAMQSSNERLPAMLQCTLPYTIYQPFTNGSGSTADEMFFGRVSELASIRDMTGTSIVYGGRQLGKTALLERAMHLDHNPARREFAIKADFKGHRGEQEFLDILVSACNDVFEKNGFKLNHCATIRDFCSQIRRLLDNDRIATLRLLLDETDDFLDSISASSYNEILPLIELQRGSNRRFKFVLAGLHNVCRAKNATRNNGLFGQLGDPLCVKPLTAADARNLLVRPLRYLGFRVSNESHVDTILTNTNYYPGIIQFFGYTLVQTLATHYTQYYDAVRGNPPFELHDDQLASIMNSRDLNRNIKDRLRWTLEMDDRYYMLARCITVLYHLYSNNYSVISNGFDVASICEVKDMYDIHCLESLSEREIVALLDEMEEMGILSRPNAEGNRYLLRRRSFIDVIGTSLESLEHDIETYNEEAVNNA